MKSKIMELLIFLRIVDKHDGLVSLTNLIAIGAIFSLFKVDAVSYAEVAGLLTAVGATTAKKFINKAKKSDSEKIVKEFKETIYQLDEKFKVSLVQKNDEIKELKELIQKAKLEQAFGPRKSNGQ